MKKTLAALGLALATAMTPGCAQDTTVGQDESDLTEIKDLYEDYRNLDLQDLTHYSAGFATSELNDALSVTDFASVRLGETELYALGSDAQDDLTLKNLDTLVSGLTQRYGHKELTTQVNQVRRDHLASSGDVAYAESSFRIKGGLHNWGYDAGGFELGGETGSTRIGFDAGVDLEARVIRAVDHDLHGYHQAPLAAIKASRGFIMPRGIDDIRDLEPGESYALRGNGRLGFNVGVGVPILVTAIDAVSYNLVLSAGMRAMLEGQVDVQLVRLGDGSVVVDVGVEQAAFRQMRVALEDGWGVSGLVKSHVELGGVSLDLGRVVEKAIAKQLNKKLNLVSAAYEKTNNHSRLSVARFRFDLNAATPGSPVEKALAQALKADIRLAQALSNAYEPGVKAEFELTRSGLSSTSYAGVDILGMSFFRKVVEKEGTIVVQTPGGARSIYFDSLHEEGGSFLSKHGYTRVALAGMTFDPQNPGGAQGEANLLLQIMEGDKKMERDKLLDHIDGVIVSLAGDEALKAIEGPGNQLQEYVDDACPESEAFDPCREEVLDDPQVAAFRAQGAAIAEQYTAAMNPELKALFMKAVVTRMTAQATFEPHAGLVGPPTTIVVDYRLDDQALTSIMLDHSRADFEAQLRSTLFATEVKRDADPSSLAGRRDKVWNKLRDDVEDAGKIFSAYRSRYQSVLEAEALVLPNHPELGTMGSRAIEIRFPVDHDNAVVYEDAIARSLPRARAHVAANMVDDLVDDLSGWFGPSKHGELLVAYSLLGMTARNKIDIRIDLDTDVSDSWAESYPQYRKAGYESFDVYAKGSAVAPIDGGLFNIDALMNLD